MSVKCYKCKKSLDLAPEKDIHRSESCNSCFASLRCCHMCTFYDTKAYNDCREPTAERVVDKEKANFCDFFKLSGNQGNFENKEKDALSAAEALFKK